MSGQGELVLNGDKLSDVEGDCETYRKRNCETSPLPTNFHFAVCLVVYILLSVSYQYRDRLV